MDEEGEEFSFFFGSAVFLEYVFFVSVDEDISGFFVFAVAAADDGADLLEGVVGVFLEEEDGSVFDPSRFAFSSATGSGRTLKPTMMAFEAFASMTSLSLIAPTAP